MSQVMSFSNRLPRSQHDLDYTNNSYPQQQDPQLHVTQQLHPSSQPPYSMPDSDFVNRVPAAEAREEVERLRRRIEQLQGSQPDSGYSKTLVPPEPPAYTPSSTTHKSSLSQASSRSSMDELSSLPSVPRAPTPNVNMSQLDKPIAIPATNKQLGSPFLRAYAPVLENYALPQEVFLRFLDNLNRVTVASPPLQVLGLAGTIVSFVPLATTMIVGNAVSFAAQAGTVAVSKGRTEIYLRKANRDIFAPRGLKVEIAKLDAIAKIADIPILDSRGKIDKKSKVLDDLTDFEIKDLYKISGQERRLRAIGQWIAPLELTPLPEIEQQSNPLSRLNQAASEQARQKGEKKLIKNREKAHEKISEDGAKAEREYEKEMWKLEKEEAKVRRKKDGYKLEKELEKVEKERQKTLKEYQKETRKLVKEDKEEKMAKKILWLVIRNLGDDSGTGPDPYTDQQS